MLLSKQKKRRRVEAFHTDEYETPCYVLDMILNELNPNEWTLWEPFPGSGHSTEYMRSKGFHVTNGSFQDFFLEKNLPKPDCAHHKLAIVTNPPYSKNKKILKQLRELGVTRMALFVPINIVANEYFRTNFPQENNQLIIHQGTCSFLNPTTHKRIGNAPFEVMWVTCGLGLKRNISYRLQI